jgi:hypothetical protein
MASAELCIPGARTCRLRARRSQARVLRALDEAAATSRIEAFLDDADLMLEQSAAYAYRPMIAEERADFGDLSSRYHVVDHACREEST